MEYRIAKGWRIFVTIFGAAFFIGGIALFYKTFTKPGFPAGVSIFLALFLSGLGAIIYLDTMRTLVTIDTHTLSIARLLRTRSALLEEIDGYRKGDKDMFYIVLKSGGRPLQLPQYLERRKELIAWFREKYEDVDARAREKETEVLLDNDQFGLTRDDRAAKLATAGKIETISAGVGTVMIFWALFYPRPFEMIMIALLAAPWTAIYATWYYKGLMKLYKKKSSPYPSMLVLIYTTTIAADMVVIKSYKLYHFDRHGWPLLLGVTAAATFICIAACRQALASAPKALTYAYIFATAGVYCYSLLVFSNCYYDRSAGDVYKVEVEHKRVSKSSKSTSYYLSLSTWGDYQGGEEFSVPRDFFNSVSTHDSVRVFLKKGKWALPWYRVVH